MDTEKKLLVQFEIVRYWTENELSNQMTYIDENEFFRRVKHPELEDARCLYRMILKLIEEHNSKIKAKRTLLSNLKYSNKWMESRVFSGFRIPLKKIDELIKENPEKNSYEIYRMLL